jgi:hypothetical protein
VPVGDVRLGLDEWRLRYMSKLSHLREIARLDRALACHAACALGGPAGLAQHLLRTLQPTASVLAFWQEVDTQWVDLWLDLLALPGHEQGRWRQQVADRVFCGGTGALAQRSAAEYARKRYAEGILDAAPTLERMLAHAAVPMDRRVWEALGIAAWARPGEASIRDAAKAQVEEAAAHIATTETQRTARLTGSSPWHAPPVVSELTAPNLLVAWARGPPTCSSAPRLNSPDAVLALRRLFGIPLAGASTGLEAPRSCWRCGAGVISAGGSLQAARPRARVDEYGEHALCCARSSGATQRRHDMVVHAARRCMEAAGWDPVTAGGPLFRGHGGRPADVWVRAHPRWPVGQAIDVTVVSAAHRGFPAAVHGAEELKRRKYRRDFEGKTGLAFTPFAIDLFGGLGAAGWEEMNQWARAIAQRSDSVLVYSQALHMVTTEIASAFVLGFVRQIREFDWGRKTPGSWLYGR